MAVEDYSGYEEDGSRDEKVKEPSFLDNLKYGLQGGTKDKMAGSFGEGLGRVAKGLAEKQYGGHGGSGGQQNSMASAFSGIKRLLGY